MKRKDTTRSPCADRDREPVRVVVRIHQKPNEMKVLILHLDQVQKRIGSLPCTVVADAGYGSEENYAYLEYRGIEEVVKKPVFNMQQKRSWRKQRFRVDSWVYDPERDEYVCPIQKRLTYQGNRARTTDNSYRTSIREFECHSCAACPLKPQCTCVVGNRRIGINPTLNHYRQQAGEKYVSDQGRRLRSRRGADVETVFGRIKQDWGFRRFTVRGIDKVRIE